MKFTKFDSEIMCGTFIEHPLEAITYEDNNST